MPIVTAVIAMVVIMGPLHLFLRVSRAEGRILRLATALYPFSEAEIAGSAGIVPVFEHRLFLTCVCVLDLRNEVRPVLHAPAGSVDLPALRDGLWVAVWAGRQTIFLIRERESRRRSSLGLVVPPGSQHKIPADLQYRFVWGLTGPRRRIIT